MSEIESASLRELDALIAERLFGWAWVTRMYVGRSACDEDKRLRNRFLAPSDQTNNGDWIVVDFRPEVTRAYMGAPHYSTTGDGMLLVLERMRELGWSYALSDVPGFSSAPHRLVGFRRGVHHALIGDPSGETVVHSGQFQKAGGMPEAVCRAALKAITAQPAAEREA